MSELIAALDRKAQDIYGTARSDWLLGFCQEVVSACAEHRRLERAYWQACTNLATVRPSDIEGATIGDDAERYHDALLAGWGGIQGWPDRASQTQSERAPSGVSGGET